VNEEELIMDTLAVYGTSSTRALAESVVHELQTSGFSLADVSVLFPDRETTREFAIDHATHAPDGAVIGATAGSAIGGTFGLLASIGAIAIPGVGPFIAAGPLLAALSAGVAGAAVGSIAGALVGLGIKEAHAHHYQRRLESGAILIAVHGDHIKRLERARKILERCGLDDVSASFDAVKREKFPTQPSSHR
jgi:hypothetical protein